ncbi:SRPBCC family protein [Haladaptatus sp. DYSN1]|uniref:SRPBCC family protein n=1 Tax=unclassified Haladaptatus TaxID=2622732 RepID=UPI00240502D3|nr:SRPBCC family protein [Haladaptatus sp. DYSN1]
MPVFERETRIRAPFEKVWDFHSRVEGLEAVTPDWMDLTIESVTGPDGEADPEILDTGTRIEMSLQPFGIGPKQRWTSVITKRKEADGEAMFEDIMERGPFPRWVHTHSFSRDGEETILHDRVEYELPGGDLGKAVSPASRIGFEPMFAGRHRATKRELE